MVSALSASLNVTSTAWVTDAPVLPGAGEMLWTVGAVRSGSRTNRTSTQ